MLPYDDISYCLYGSKESVLGLLDVWGARHKKRIERYQARLLLLHLHTLR